MITRLYSVYDSVAEEYGPIFQAKNDDVALRNVIQMFTEMNVSIASLESYHLYHVGDFDSELGTLVERSVNPIAIDIDYGALANVFDAYMAYRDAVKKSKNVSRETKEDK